VAIVLVAMSVGSVSSKAAPSRLGLPSAAASTPIGPLDGRWKIVDGSVAGFRVQVTEVGTAKDSVGRTKAVAGNIAISANRVTSARFRVDLSTVKVAGKAAPQFVSSLETQRYPRATFTLTQPTTLSSTLRSGETVMGKVTGQLAMHGASRPVTFTVSERRDGPSLQIAGSTPIAFTDWGIKGPKGYGFLGSVADHGMAEVLLVLQRQ
jgi:polyisoprenoid-binding protein YceI